MTKMAAQTSLTSVSEMPICVSYVYSIYLRRRDGRLSWPRWLVRYQDSLPTCRWPPIRVLTGPSVD